MAQVQLTTDVKNYEYAAMVLGASAPAARFPTTTRPATVKGTLVVGGTQNYLKLQMYVENSEATQNIVVNGWNFCSSKMTWVPQFLFKGTGSAINNVLNLPFGSNLKLVGDYTTTGPLVAGSPTNSKSLSPVSADALGFGGHTLLIDCVGSQFIEINVWGDDNKNNHVLYSSI